MTKEIGRKFGMEEWSEVVRLYAETVTTAAIGRAIAVRDMDGERLISFIHRLARQLNDFGAVLRLDPGELAAEYDRINRQTGIRPSLNS
jgi:hypothetical protein